MYRLGLIADHGWQIINVVGGFSSHGSMLVNVKKKEVKVERTLCRLGFS